MNQPATAPRHSSSQSSSPTVTMIPLAVRNALALCWGSYWGKAWSRSVAANEVLYNRSPVSGAGWQSWDEAVARFAPAPQQPRPVDLLPPEPEPAQADAAVMEQTSGVEPIEAAQLTQPEESASKDIFEQPVESDRHATPESSVAARALTELESVMDTLLASSAPTGETNPPHAGIDLVPETTVLPHSLTQKEPEMTNIPEVLPEVDPSPVAAPVVAAELQEVAAVLSIPRLDAEPDDVLSDVQNTLNSLAGMAQGLTQQKQAAVQLQDELEERSNQLQERERQVGDKEERLRQLEGHLKEAKVGIDRMTAENNRLLTERSEALKELAQSVDARDKTTLKRAEAIQVEQQRVDELAASLRTRVAELDERESALKRKSEELALKLKQLQSAKDKFSSIVKSFNETVQFNSTLSAISKTVAE